MCRSVGECDRPKACPLTNGVVVVPSPVTQDELPTYRELRKEVTRVMGEPFSSKEWRKWFRTEVDAMFALLDEAEGGEGEGDGDAEFDY